MNCISRNRKFRLQVLWVLPVAAALLPGCTRDGEFSPVDMWNRSRYKPYEPVAFFDDQNSSRTPAQNTVARGHLRIDDRFYSGVVNGRYSTEFPMPVTKEMVGRGQERYNIYCLPCHGVAGQGDGMIVKRGFAPPPDYRIRRLRNAPVGHFYEVITNGYGAMYSYADRVTPQDRWAIASYIRALQNVDKTVVPDIRYRENQNSNGAARPNSQNASGTPGSVQSGANRQQNNIGTVQNPGSTSQLGVGGPGPKSPAGAMPAPNATPGMEERGRRAF